MTHLRKTVLWRRGSRGRDWAWPGVWSGCPPAGGGSHVAGQRKWRTRGRTAGRLRCPPAVEGRFAQRYGQVGGPAGWPRRLPAGRGPHAGEWRVGRTRERRGGGPGGRTGRPRPGKVGHETVRGRGITHAAWLVSTYATGARGEKGSSQGGERTNGHSRWAGGRLAGRRTGGGRTAGRRGGRTDAVGT